MRRDGPRSALRPAPRPAPGVAPGLVHLALFGISLAGLAKAGLAAAGLGTVGIGLASLAVPALTMAAEGPAPAAPDGWHSFEGSWSASGSVQTLPIDTKRAATTVQVSGSIVLVLGEGLSRGFRFEALGFDDGRSLSVGCAVWTDERGDRIFSDFRGEPLGTGRHTAGAFTGGTGRYAGIVGEYAFDWQYVVKSEEGLIQARAVGLTGRWRRAAAPASGDTPREERR